MLKIKKMAVASLAVFGLGMPWASSQAAVAGNKKDSSTYQMQKRTSSQDRLEAAANAPASALGQDASSEGTELDENSQDALQADSSDAVDSDAQQADSSDAVEPEEPAGSSQLDEVSQAEEPGDSTATDQLEPVAGVSNTYSSEDDTISGLAPAHRHGLDGTRHAKALRKAYGKAKAYKKLLANKGRKHKMARTSKTARAGKTLSGRGSASASSDP